VVIKTGNGSPPTSCLPYLALPPHLLAAAAIGAVDSNGIRFETLERVERQPRCLNTCKHDSLYHISRSISILSNAGRYGEGGPICVVCCCVSGESLLCPCLLDAVQRAKGSLIPANGKLHPLSWTIVKIIRTTAQDNSPRVASKHSIFS
jgi:hypothetical protein